MKTLVAAVTLLLVSSVAAREEPKPPELFGLALPFPKKLRPFPQTPKWAHHGPLTYITFTLQINRGGKVKQAEPDTTGDTNLVSRSRQYLKKVVFYPAKRVGKKTEVKLPVLLTYRNDVPFPRITFPIDTTLTNIDNKLLAAAYRLNGVEFPELVSFPPYACPLKKIDSSISQPYVILKVSLDSTGALTGVGVVRSTYPAFNTQLESATLRAEFAPARLDGKPVASDAFLVVSLFPQLDYPIGAWERSRLAEMPLLNRVTVRLCPDTIGLMLLPVPRLRPADSVTYSGPNMNMGDSIDYYFSIDTLGRLRLRPESPVSAPIRVTQAGIAKLLRFYPALGFDGRRRPFYGFASVILDYSTEIRIRYHWLVFP